MDLHFDVDSRKFRVSATDSRNPEPFTSKRGDSDEVRVMPVKNAAAYVLPGTVSEFLFVVKETAADDGVTLLLAEDLTLDTETGFYIGTITENGEALAALFATSNNAKRLKAEVTFTDSTLGTITTETRDYVLANDLWKGTEGTPLNLPTPDAWVAAKQAAVIRTAAEGSPSYPQSMVIAGELTSDGVIPAIFGLIPITNPQSGRIAWESPTGDAALWSGSYWALLHGESAAEFWSTDDVITPDLCTTWVAQGSATGVPTVTAGSQLPPEFIGQLCRVGDDPDYTWYRAKTLTEWEDITDQVGDAPTAASVAAAIAEDPVAAQTALDWDETLRLRERANRNRLRMQRLRDDLESIGVLDNLVWSQCFGEDGENSPINRGQLLGVDQRAGSFGLIALGTVTLPDLTGDFTLVAQAGFCAVSTGASEAFFGLEASTAIAGTTSLFKEASNSYSFVTASSSSQKLAIPTSGDQSKRAVMIGTLNAATNEKIAYLNGAQVATVTYAHPDLAALIKVKSAQSSASQRVNRAGLGMVFNRVLTPAECAAVSASILQSQQCRRMYVDGDSMSATIARVGSLYGTQYPLNLYKLHAESGNYITTIDTTAVGGTTPAQAVARFDTDYADAAPATGEMAPIYVSWTGINSVDDSTTEEVMIQLRLLWAKARAKGFVVLQVSVTRSLTYPAEALALNEAMKLEEGVNFDGYVDLDAALVEDFGSDYASNATIMSGPHIIDHAAHLCLWRALDRKISLFE